MSYRLGLNQHVYLNDKRLYALFQVNEYSLYLAMSQHNLLVSRINSFRLIIWSADHIVSLCCCPTADPKTDHMISSSYGCRTTTKTNTQYDADPTNTQSTCHARMASGLANFLNPKQRLFLVLESTSFIQKRQIDESISFLLKNCFHFNNQRNGRSVSDLESCTNGCRLRVFRKSHWIITD